MEKIKIQGEISITQKEWIGAVKHYEEMPDTFGMGIGGKMLDKKGIIEEITNLTDIGKKILLVRYEFEKWQKSLSKIKPSADGSSNRNFKEDCKDTRKRIA